MYGNIRQWFPKFSLGEGFDLPDPTDLLGVYSLRKLSSYSGFCIRVIRDSDLSTLDIGFVDGLVDTASIVTFCTGTTGRVNRWYDQSGNANNAMSDVTEARRPVIYEGGAINMQGGKPTLRWGVIGTMGITEINVKSAFFVYKIGTLSTVNALTTGNTNDDQFIARFVVGSVSSYVVFKGNAVKVTNSSGNLNYNLSSFFGGTDDKIDTNSNDPVTSSNVIDSIPVVNIGRPTNNFSLRGNMHEVIFYSTSQFANKDTIENMINDYYSIY